MDIHRSDSVPDWEKVDPSQWNVYQIRAAETNGWDTPGNRQTILGASEVAVGLYLISQDQVLLGSILVADGRRRDLKDGQVADATGTKSPTGEALDAGLDTLLIFGAIPVLVKAGILTEVEGVTLGVIHTAKSGFSLKAKAEGKEPHPSWLGKIGAGGQWGGIMLRTLAKAVHNSRFERIRDFGNSLRNLGTITLWSGIGIGTTSLPGYGKHAFQPLAANEKPLPVIVTE